MTQGRKALDEFGKAVTKEVFDRSCSFLQDTISHGMNGNKPDPLCIAYNSLDPKSAEVLRVFLKLAVDQTFAQFLNFFDVHEIPIPFATSSGAVVDVRAASDGLAAEPYNDWGWIAKYSVFKDGIMVE
jgi:hypothetical protein